MQILRFSKWTVKKAAGNFNTVNFLEQISEYFTTFVTFMIRIYMSSLDTQRTYCGSLSNLRRIWALGGTV